jgi:hypothetical protein
MNIGLILLGIIIFLLVWKVIDWLVYKPLRKLWWILFIIVVAAYLSYSYYPFTASDVVCTIDAKTCPDGTSVGRNPDLNCEFNECPELQFCDIDTPCPEEMDCYSFPDEENPVCYLGDPCIKCESKICEISESAPAKITCK